MSIQIKNPIFDLDCQSQSNPPNWIAIQQSNPAICPEYTIYGFGLVNQFVNQINSGLSNKLLFCSELRVHPLMTTRS